jgi:hypothetical protein
MLVTLPVGMGTVVEAAPVAGPPFASWNLSQVMRAHAEPVEVSIVVRPMPHVVTVVHVVVVVVVAVVAPDGVNTFTEPVQVGTAVPLQLLDELVELVESVLVDVGSLVDGSLFESLLLSLSSPLSPPPQSPMEMPKILMQGSSGVLISRLNPADGGKSMPGKQSQQITGPFEPKIRGTTVCLLSPGFVVVMNSPVLRVPVGMVCSE